MKKLLLLLPLVIAFGIKPVQTMRLSWSYPLDEIDTNMVFNLYTSQDITVPLTNWIFYTNITGTNLWMDVTLTSGRQFFFITASNLWGESNPSNILVLPAIPRDDQMLTIKRIP